MYVQYVFLFLFLKKKSGIALSLFLSRPPYKKQWKLSSVSFSQHVLSTVVKVCGRAGAQCSTRCVRGEMPSGNHLPTETKEAEGKVRLIFLAGSCDSSLMCGHTVLESQWALPLIPLQLAKIQ